MSIGRLLASVVAVSLTVLGAASSSAAASDAPALAILGPSSVSVKLDRGGTQTQPFTIKVQNNTSTTLVPVFRVLLQEGNDQLPAARVVPAKSAALPSIEAGKTIGVEVIIKDLPQFARVAGELAVGGGDAIPSATAVSIAPAPPQQTYRTSSGLIFLVPGLAALVGLLIGGVLLRSKLGTSLAQEDLDFSSGFASTATLVSTALATIVSAAVIPDQTAWLSKDTYVALNVIFGASIAFSALIFKAFQTERDGKLHGFVGSFLVAAGVTTWAALGELFLLWFLIWDINGTKGFTHGGTVLVHVILVGTAILLGIYIVRRTKQITSTNAAKASAGTPARAPRLSRGLL